MQKQYILVFILIQSVTTLFSQNLERENKVVELLIRFEIGQQDAVIPKLEKFLLEEGLNKIYYPYIACKIHNYYYQNDSSAFDCNMVNHFVDEYIQSGVCFQNSNLIEIDYFILKTTQMLNGKNGSYIKQLQYLELFEKYFYHSTNIDESNEHLHVLHAIIRTSDYANMPEIGIKYCKKAMELSNNILLNTDELKLQIVNNIANNYILIEDTVNAKKYLDYSILVAELVYTKQHQQLLIYLKQVEDLYLKLGITKDLIVLNNRIVDVSQKIYGDKDWKYMRALNELALYYSRLGEYHRSFEINLQLVKLSKDEFGEEYLDCLTYLHNLAVNYSDLGNNQKMLEISTFIVETSKKILGEKHPTYLTFLNGLASSYFNAREYQKAHKIFIQLADSSNIHILQREKYLTILNNLAICCLELNDYQKSLDVVMQAVDIGKEFISEKHVDIVYLRSLHNLALIHSYLGDFDKSFHIYFDVVNQKRKLLGEDHPDYLLSIQKLAFVEAYDGQVYNSTNHYSEYYTKSRDRIIKYFSTMSESQRNFFLNKYSYSFNRVPSFLSQDQTSISIYTGEIYDASLFIKGLLLNTTQDFEELIQEKGSSEVIAKFEELKRLKFQAQKLEEQPIKERYLSLDSLQDVIQIKEMELVKLSAEYGEYTNNLKISWKDVQSKLKKNEVAIEFVEYPTLSDTVKYAALTLRKNWSAPKMISLFQKDQLEKWINSTPDSIYSNTTTGKKFKELIWKPLEEYIDKDEKVYFSASGLLYKIAIENLPVNDSMTIGDCYSLYRLSSTKELVTRKRSKVNKTAVLYGGLNYNMNDSMMLVESKTYSSTEKLYAFRAYIQDSTLRAGFDYLPATMQEVEEIGQLMQNYYQVGYLGSI